MKHGILAHQQIDTITPVELYTFGGPAAYALHLAGSVSGMVIRINGKYLPNPTEKHLANAGDVLTIIGNGTVLLEGIEQ
jgi:hypothetical protein